MKNNQSGQAILEYVLMLSIVVSFFVTLMGLLRSMGIEQSINRSFTKEYAAAYRYGHPKAKGMDEGEPQYHPRLESGDTSFRLFMNPKTNQ